MFTMVEIEIGLYARQIVEIDFNLFDIKFIINQRKHLVPHASIKFEFIPNLNRNIVKPYF